MTEKNDVATAEAKNIVLPDSGKIRERILVLKNLIDQTYWEMAELVYGVFKHKTYKEWGFDTFNEYIESDVRVSARKGRYLAQIYSWFAIQNPDLKDEVKELGWWQAKELVGIKEPEEVKSLAEKAKESSAREFVDHMKKYRQQQDGSPPPVETELLQTLSFKIPNVEVRTIEEALDMAQNITGGARSKALAYIALEFTASYTVQEDKKIDIADALSRYERITGLSLIAIEKGNFVYGHDKVKEMMEEPRDGDDAGKEE